MQKYNFVLNHFFNNIQYEIFLNSSLTENKVGCQYSISYVPERFVIIFGQKSR